MVADEASQYEYPDLNPGGGLYARQGLPYYIPGYERSYEIDDVDNTFEDQSEDGQAEEEDEDAPLDGIPFIPDGSANIFDEDFELPDNASEHDVDEDTDSSSSASGAAAGEGTGRRGAPRGRGRGRGGRGRGWGLGPGSQGGKVRNRGGLRGRPRGVRGVPRGDGMRGGRKGKRGPRAIAEPSPEFKALQGRATTAFLEGDFETAADFSRQAIQNNPEVFAAHSLLSQIYLEMGNREESLAVLWSGAHTKRETGVWWEVAHRTKELAGEDTVATSNQLMYCYSQIIRLDSSDFEARKGRLDQYMDQGFKGKAIRECEQLLRLRPNDLDCLQMLAELCRRGDEVESAKKAYEKAVKHYRSVQMDGFGGGFSFSDLNIYLEVFASLEQWDEGVATLKSLARWLCGRRGELYWDKYPGNDCEWDLEDAPRRVLIPEFQPSPFGSEAYGDGLPPEIRAKLGIFRLHLGPGHRKEALHHFEFFDPEDTSEDAPVNDYPDLFREIADILHETGNHKEALRFFEPLQRFHGDLELPVMMRMAKSYHLSGSPKSAIEILEDAVKLEPQNTDIRIELGKIYEQIGEAAKAFEHVAEVIKLGREDIVKRARLAMHKPVDQPVRKVTEERSTSSTDNESEEDDPNSLFITQKTTRKVKPKKPAVKHASIKPSTPSFRRSEPQNTYSLETIYHKLQSLTPAMRTKDQESTVEWISLAEQLLDTFKSAKVFYPAESYVPFLGYTAEAKRRAWKSRQGTQRSETEMMAERLKTSLGEQPDASSEGLEDLEIPQHAIPTDYRNIPFTAWLDTFLELAFVHAAHNNGEASYAVLTATSEASIFHHTPEYIFRVHVCWFACALRLADEERLCNEVRWFVKTFNYATDGFRLYAALNRIYTGDSTWYNSGPLQKFFLRAIKALDYALLGETQRPRWKFSEQEKQSYLRALTKDETAGPDALPAFPPTHDPFLLLMYGHLLASAGSYPNALHYYLRAYALQPTLPLTVFSIAVAYLQHALKRQCDNRHAYVLQGVAFLKEYRRLRLEDGEGGWAARMNRRMEVEFNEARAWHLLGLLHLAVPAYERVLAIEEEVPERDEDSMLSDWGDEVEVVKEQGFAREAAYALQGILVMGGDMVKAREITERWLVF